MASGSISKGGISGELWLTTMPSAKASSKFSSGYFFATMRSGGALASGLLPVRPTAWQREQLSCTITRPRAAEA